MAAGFIPIAAAVGELFGRRRQIGSDGAECIQGSVGINSTVGGGFTPAARDQIRSGRRRLTRRCAIGRRPAVPAGWCGCGETFSTAGARRRRHIDCAGETAARDRPRGRDGGARSTVRAGRRRVIVGGTAARPLPFFLSRFGFSRSQPLIKNQCFK